MSRIDKKAHPDLSLRIIIQQSFYGDILVVVVSSAIDISQTALKDYLFQL